MAKQYSKLTAKMAINLAAPHTWPAAIMPALLALCASANVCTISVSMGCTLLLIVVLMQSAVNTFNDYYDFVKGSDTAEDNVEASDATLVYSGINPKSALKLGAGFLVAAFLLGAYIVWYAGWVPLALGIVGAGATVLYSAGKTPISYLPIGEAVSGIVMGGLIPLACFYALTGRLTPSLFACCIPTVCGVALIMATNNTCDIEKDVAARRKTLPVLLGRPKARKLYRVVLAVWAVSASAVVCTLFTTGAVMLPFACLALYPLFKNVWANPLVPESRIGAMGQICGLNVAFGAFYAAAILACGSAVLMP